MRPNPKKALLYRRVNTRTHGVYHHAGGDARHDRNTKARKTAEAAGIGRGKMTSGVRHGLDYTPLYRFLLSQVGSDWASVHSAAVARLDRPDPIAHMVAEDRSQRAPYFLADERSFYSGLFVDEADHLQLVAPDLTVARLWPSCPCCTHSFNGTRFSNPYQEGRDGYLGLGAAYFRSFSE